MGSGQSARKLTISNEEEVGVIKVSNAIVQRLAQQDGSENESIADARPATPRRHPAPPGANLVPPGANPVPPAPTESPGRTVYYPEFTLSALQMQQRMEEELKQQHQYWNRRLQNLEEGYQKINRILDDEYKKSVSETSAVKTGQAIVDVQGTARPCLEGSNKVLKCFQDHPKETLKCSDLVDEFSNCVWNEHYSRVIEARV